MSVHLTLELDPICGEDPWDVLASAVRVADHLKVLVQIELNGVTLVAGPGDKIDKLMEAYKARAG